jgi:hypothetical protein
MGADFNATGDEPVPGFGGFRAAVFRWYRTHRFGLEVGLNSEFCDDEDGRCPLVIPLGLEADWLLLASDRASFGAAFAVIGLRAMAYAPVSATDTPPVFSLQPTLRLIASFPPGGSRPMPAGLTLDHSIHAGPALAPSGATALLVGFSIGIGWAH